MSANQNKTVDGTRWSSIGKHSASSAAFIFAFLPGSSNFILRVISEYKDVWRRIMNRKLTDRRGGTWAIFLLALAFCALFTENARAFVVNVVDPVGAPITGGFRWLLEEDNTNVTVPGVPVRVRISTDIHNSHAPVVNTGQVVALNSVTITTDASNSPLDANKRYFISVLPNSGYSISGTVVVAPNPATVTVTVNPLPLPTAQISLFAFVDHNPINSIANPQEQGLGGATIIVSDAAGQLTQDAFGNPLGTQYAFDPITGQAIVDVDGNPTVAMLGNGVITTLTQGQFNAGAAANPYNLRVGEVLIKYLVPGKYGVKVVPPGFDDAGAAMKWSQTSTIEGTPTVDAWVKANEPKLFVEGFGTGFNHVFYGFLKISPATSTFQGQTFTTLEWNQTPPAAATGTITGTLRMNHFSRPPTLQGFFPGIPVAGGWVGLNDPLVQPGGQTTAVAGKYAAACNEDGSFVINNVPPGTYQLITWDTNLDTIFGFYTVTVPPGVAGTGDAVTLGNVLTFRWFGALESYVFFDADEDGFRDPGEPGIPEQNVNLRFRDGTIYQTFPTDRDGFVPFDEVFPYFKWLVVEVDFARFKATGMTTAVDYGGPIPGPDWPANGSKNPQPQNPADPFNVHGTLDYRTETGPVLTQAMHLFLGQTNLIEWGKSSYKAGENGGITGIVFYAVTHAENDPRYAAAETWEPGIPRVQVNLYQDMVVNATGLPGSDGVVDDLNGDTVVTLADVDNYPFQWAPVYAAAPGFTGSPGPEDTDRSYPGQTVGVFNAGDAIQIATTDSWDDSKPSGCIQNLPFLTGLGYINECADSFGTWNQVRPGIFDGGYAFDSYHPGGIASGSTETAGLPRGSYIVESVPPPGYELLKEEDKNVDFGDTYIPSPLLLPPVCVGDLHPVPAFMSFDGVTPAPFAGEVRPYCDRKQVNMGTGQNAAADFFLFTQVPKAARAVGFVNNDLGAEFNQASPIYGEKLAAAWIPVSFRDWKGKELVRVYADEFGGYNALLPSTYTVNVPSPTGVSPSMITVVLNDPFLADGVTPDLFYDPDYAVTPWTFHYMPGTTSYLDTPIVPITAFAASGVRLDTGPANGTPVIHAVTTNTQAGPLVCTNANPLPATVTINATPGGTITIRNPEYPALSSLPTIIRDVGFGTAQGNGRVTLDGVALTTVVSWNNTAIQLTLPAGSATGRLMVTRDNGLVSEIGVTLSIVDCSGLTVRTVAALGSIQTAVDAAVAGDIILVGTGVFNENVVMNKPVRLQGGGAGSVINGNPTPLDRLDAWHTRVNALDPGTIITAYNLNTPFSAGEAPGVFVVGATLFPNGQTFNPGNPFTLPDQAAIDGFTILGSKAGGGIFVFSGAVGLEISNNNITNNQGSYAGGIAIGAPDLGLQGLGFDPINDGVIIRHNKIHRNGGIQGGGGIALNEGSDGYLVDENIIIGNFGRYNGGGIQHRGLSLGDNVISKNRILFNEVFYGALLALAGDGAGIFIGGDTAGGTGSGSVTIDGNLIQGNMTGSGNGGGIRAFAVNGDDVAASPGVDTTWYRLDIFNNMIVNNVAGNSGAGISLQDVVRANIVNNTIARNDSTATSALTFQAGQANSTPQPAGIVAGLHSTILQGLFTLPGEPTYSNPQLVNNIIWQNRSFYNVASLNGGAGGLAVNPAGEYWDLHVMGSVSSAAPHLNPDYCILTSLTNPATGFDYTLGGTDTTNSLVDPGFIGAYFNTVESTTVVDEGGNAINIRFTPLTVLGSNYHLGTGQAGSNGPLAAFLELGLDFDREPRPFGPATDIGADEVQPAAIPLLRWDGSKKVTDTIQTGARPQTSTAAVPAGMIAGLAGTIDAAKEKLAGMVESIMPGRGHFAGSGSDDSGSATVSPLTGNVPDIVNGKDVSIKDNQLLTMGAITGDEGINPPDNTSTPLAEGEVAGQAFSSPVPGDASLPGNGVESSLSATQADQPSGTSLANTRQQSEPKSTMFRYILVGLILSGLALIFFIVIMPKIKKRREQ